MLLLLRSLLEAVAVEPPVEPPATVTPGGIAAHRRPMLWLPYIPQPVRPVPQGRARKRRQEDIVFMGH